MPYWYPCLMSSSLLFVLMDSHLRKFFCCHFTRVEGTDGFNLPCLTRSSTWSYKSKIPRQCLLCLSPVQATEHLPSNTLLVFTVLLAAPSWAFEFVVTGPGDLWGSIQPWKPVLTLCPKGYSKPWGSRVDWQEGDCNPWVLNSPLYSLGFLLGLGRMQTSLNNAIN